MKNSFLLKFAQPCCSPGRVHNDEKFFYDTESDMVRSSTDPKHQFAIEISGIQGPKTKKCDIEKGDDNKDRRMWQ